jgi:hypothetical protein
MDSLTLGDHSCEVINGLSELYLTVSRVMPEKREPIANRSTSFSTGSSKWESTSTA